MVYIFVFSIGIILAVLGISEVLHILSHFVVKPRIKPYRRIVTVLDEDDAEMQVLSVLCEFHWSGRRYADKAVFLTDDLPKSLAQKLEKEYKSDFAEFKNGDIYGRHEKGIV